MLREVVLRKKRLEICFASFSCYWYLRIKSDSGAETGNCDQPKKACDESGTFDVKQKMNTSIVSLKSERCIGDVRQKWRYVSFHFQL